MKTLSAESRRGARNCRGKRSVERAFVRALLSNEIALTHLVTQPAYDAARHLFSLSGSTRVHVYGCSAYWASIGGRLSDA